MVCKNITGAVGSIGKQTLPTLPRPALTTRDTPCKYPATPTYPQPTMPGSSIWHLPFVAADTTHDKPMLYSDALCTAMMHESDLQQKSV